MTSNAGSAPTSAPAIDPLGGPLGLAGTAGAPAAPGGFRFPEFHAVALTGGHLSGRLPGAAVDADAEILQGSLETWGDPGVPDGALTFEMHAKGVRGAGMVLVRVRDVEGVAALLRGPGVDGTVEGGSGATAMRSPAEITGCSGPALQDYDWDNSNEDAEAELSIDSVDPDTVQMRAVADFGRDGTMRGTATFSRDELLPLLEQALAP